MKTYLPTIVLCTVSSTISFAADSTAEDAGRVAFFERKVRPLLIDRCGECHGEENSEGDLVLTSVGGLAAGGESGFAVIPGKPDQSRLIQAVRFTSKLKMPPDGKLTKAEISILESWVRSGASLPGATIVTRPTRTTSTMPLTDDDLRWWSFQPVRDYVPPQVVNEYQVRTPVDRFILRKLEQHGLALSPVANRSTLLRRITFNLTGLPPTPDELDVFLNDTRPDAYERVVDRLLASPRYGERWGRHWLDVARYADTNGGGFDYVYPNAWHYRDYVVRAFNEDKPYDEFLTEQLAGDLLSVIDNEDEYVERLKATGFLTLAPKGLGMQDKELMALDVVDDQIDVLGRSLMGLTLSCARCHDHKFDPVSTRDYYSLAGIFRSTVSLTNVDKNPSFWPERPLEHPATTKARNDYKTQLAANQTAITGLVNQANKALTDDARSRFDAYLLAAAMVFRDSSAQPAVAHWSFDRIENGHVAATAGPMGRLANLQTDKDGPLPQQTEGRIGNSLAFHGQRDVVTVKAADTAVFNFGKSSDFTVSFWLKTQDEYSPQTADTVIAARYPSALWFVALRPGPYNGIYLRHYDGKRSIDVKPSANRLPMLTDRQWHHIVFTSDRDGAAAVWIDGTKAGDASIASISSAADFTHGSEFSIGASNNGFRGSLDDVALWNRMLSPTEIARLFNLGEATNEPLDVASIESRRRHQNGDSKPFTIESAAKQGLVPQILRTLVTRLNEADGASASPFLEVVNELPSTIDEARAAIDRAGPSLQKLLDDGKMTPLRIEGDASAFYPTETRQQLMSLREARARLDRNKVPDAVQAMVAYDGSTPADLRVAIAGDHQNLGDAAPRGFPKVINVAAMAERDIEPVPADKSGRLELARWLTRADHPLTARVMVNRIWQHHFGAGLTRTPDNFGRLGERPSHPKLLDWLSARLIHDGWSIKQLHRHIVLSSTYRQSSSSTAGRSVDSGNRLLWRMNRNRLEAEAIRDALLLASGTLDPRMGGTVNDWKPKMFSVNDSNAETANYRTNRRSIYLPVVRGAAVHPMLQLFDFGDPNSLTPRRDTTTVASQALFFLNNPFVVKQSASLARRLLADTVDNDDARIREMYRLVLSREPTSHEMNRAAQFLVDGADEETWALYCQSLFCLSEFVYLD